MAITDSLYVTKRQVQLWRVTMMMNSAAQKYVDSPSKLDPHSPIHDP